LGLFGSISLGVLGASPAQAHGGLPISNQILWRGDTMLVPTLEWGMFVGSDTGPWSWICDEAINTYILRQIYLGGDGTLYATAASGVTVSRDGGCTWAATGGGVAALDYPMVATDLVASSRVWVAANTTQTELWRSDDAAMTWQRNYALPGFSLTGLALHPDGQTVHLGVISTGANPQPAIYTSSDGGSTYQAHSFAPLSPDLSLSELKVLGADPRDAAVVYLTCPAGAAQQVLLRVDVQMGTASELLRLADLIYAVTVDTTRDRLLIATASGVYYADGMSAVQHFSGLSYARCFSVHGNDDIYACSTNYMPDLAAVAKSTDGGQTFAKVFQFVDTQGVQACPAGSGVATICPAIWAGYSAQLGNNPGLNFGLLDMGTGTADLAQNPSGGPLPNPPSTGGSGCSAAGRAPAGGLGLLLFLLAAGFSPLFRRLLRRRGVDPAERSAGDVGDAAQKEPPIQPVLADAH
jgi:hypothetical protein